MSERELFPSGEDRLACPACGTHSALDRRRCWNCGADLSPADRIPYVHGQHNREPQASKDGADK